MNLEYEIFREGLTRTINIKSHAYDLIEFTIKQKLVDDKGNEIVNTGNTTFYSSKEFVDFFGPIINELKVRIDNGISNSFQE